jgi:hypothetical protein
MVRSRLFPVGLLALALAAGPAAADPPPGMSKLWPWNVGWAPPSAAPARPAPAPTAAPAGSPGSVARQSGAGAFVVTVTSPKPVPLYVDIRGPDGTVRRFPVAGGPATIQVRQVIVRPGETATVRVPRAVPGK